MINKIDFPDAIFLHKKRITGSIFALDHREIFQI